MDLTKKNPNPNARKEIIAVRVSSEELVAIKELANKLTDGNVGLLIRCAISILMEETSDG